MKPYTASQGANVFTCQLEANQRGRDVWRDGVLVGVEAVDIPPEELATARFDAWEKIKSERTRHENGGVLVDGKWYHSDEPSRLKFVGMVMKGASLPTGIMWKTMDGTFIEMTPSLVVAVFTAFFSYDITNFSVAEQHRLAMIATATPETYDCSSNWLPSYGDA